MQTEHTIQTVVIDILSEILDLDPADIRPESGVMADLDAVSIDLLEIGVALSARFGVSVDDEAAFLTGVPSIAHIAAASGTSATEALAEALPHLTRERLARLAENPAADALTVEDIIRYLRHTVR